MFYAILSMIQTIIIMKWIMLILSIIFVSWCFIFRQSINIKSRAKDAKECVNKLRELYSECVCSE